MKRFEMVVNGVNIVTQLETEDSKINYCITAFDCYNNIVYRNINSTETEATLEGFYNNEIVTIINSIDFKTISVIENIKKYDCKHWESLINKGSNEFNEAYNKLLSIAQSTGQDDGDVRVQEIANNIYTFKISAWNRNGKLTWDFSKNCKADLRKKYYKDLIA